MKGVEGGIGLALMSVPRCGPTCDPPSITASAAHAGSSPAGRGEHGVSLLRRLALEPLDILSLLVGPTCKMGHGQVFSGIGAALITLVVGSPLFPMPNEGNLRGTEYGVRSIIT